MPRVFRVLAVALAVPSLCPPASAAPTPERPVPRIDPAAHAGYRETIGDSGVTFDLAAVPGGVFWMGSAGGEPGRGADEGPRRLVQVRPFWMGTCEVTWDEYDLFRRQTRQVTDQVPRTLRFSKWRWPEADAVTGPSPPYPDEYRGFGRDRYPVVGITHHAAMEYCRWLSAKTGKAYRLPTEAEWEWACRAGTQTAYPFGDAPDRLGDYAWYAANSREETHPVGRKKPNAWGLYDMHGNVAEWCLDHYQKDRYALFAEGCPTVAPVKVPTADRYPHVARGGSWDDPAARCRSAARRSSAPDWNKFDPDRPRSIWWLWDADFVGFRVVRAVEEQDELKGIRSRVTKQSKWRGSLTTGGSGRGVEVEGGVERRHRRLRAAADDDRDAAVVQRHQAGLRRRQAEQRRQVGAVDDVVGHHQQGGAGVGVEEAVEGGGDAGQHVGEGLAAGVAVAGRVVVEGAVALGIEVTDGGPVEAFPAADVALGQLVERLRRDAVRGGDDGGGLHGAQQRAAIAQVEAAPGEEVARGLGLADADAGQRRVVAAALQTGRVGQVGLRRPVADQVQHRRRVAARHRASSCRPPGPADDGGRAGRKKQGQGGPPERQPAAPPGQHSSCNAM
jgi:formylglycine-generating enzyme required for sulfatase activity